MAYGDITRSPSAGNRALSAKDRQRLAALAEYEVLDSEAEEAFDEIVFTAKTVCDTPMALISLVDRDRQWFKARIGFDPCQTPIEQSVCSHGMYSDELMVIPDLTADPRTRDNRLVDAPDGVRFYAGAPLVTPGGAVIGMLCVLDVKVRPGGLDPAQRRILKSLSKQVITQLELRKSLRTAEREMEQHKSQTEVLKRASKRLQLAEEAGNVGAFELNCQTRMVKVSPEFCRIYGFDNVETIHGNTIAERRRAFTDVPVEASSMAAADHQVIEEYEILRANDAEPRWLELRARYVAAEEGRAPMLVGIVSDVTEQHMVNEEIAHRLKNTLALVQAVAGHTLRGIPDPGPVHEFNRRISALATAHDLLLSRSRAAGCLQELARGVFDKLGIEQRVDMSGHDRELASRPLLTLSMILHELATNAMKYGALSVPDGRVELRVICCPKDEDGEEWLTLKWTELNGPPAATPNRKGLGTRLIERGLDPEGEVEMIFGENGFALTLAAPMKNLTK
ncbi:sensor histidine kinase [Croceicoccus marinus]|jgi:PAS domain S-box-containing protein|uniref:histidine kinase n=1 Tax=Croceicoccus marinus TaxID=450378 RepID=A0A7G6VVG8_9SPHN|nr:HWE histidine kinase domain-containing protein [Croceicoccus marinus]QNE05733.1 GAF domain-containing protein [Croceicoccus marinus]